MVTNKAMSILFLFYMDINLLYVPVCLVSACVWFHVNTIICLKCKMLSLHLRFKVEESCLKEKQTDDRFA